MNNYNAKHGLLAGAIVIALDLILYLINVNWYFMASSVGGIVPVYFMVQAVLEERKENGGLIPFPKAFSHAWVTYLIYSVLITIFTFVLYNIIDPNLSVLVKEKAIEAFQKMSGFLGEKGVEEAIEEMDKTDQFSLQSMAIGFLSRLLFPGAIIALIIGLIMKKEGDPFEQKSV
jgi:hypothetical protein